MIPLVPVERLRGGCPPPGGLSCTSLGATYATTFTVSAVTPRYVLPPLSAPSFQGRTHTAAR